MPDPEVGATAVHDAAPLVSAEWLSGQLANGRILVIDIRSAVDGGGRAAYEQAHVPGAVHTDYAKDGWRATKGMAPGLLPDASRLSELLGGLGLTPDHHAVIVSAGTSLGDFSASARVYWTIKIVGHPHLSILDGGMAEWQRDAGRPVESGVTEPRRVPPYPVRIVPGLRAEVAAVEACIADASAIMLDSRSKGFFEGRDKSPQAARAGRLPGAQHLDHSEAFDSAAGKLKPRAELMRLFAQVAQQPVVNYCNTGHQAATNWFILSEILGRPNVMLYDGSMSEWTEDSSRPVT